MLLVDDYSNVGWVLFLKDQIGSTVTQAFRAFFAAIKPLIAIHGPVGSLRTDNGLEFVNDDFKHADGAEYQAGVDTRRRCQA